jgi:hypothetical protein
MTCTMMDAATDAMAGAAPGVTVNSSCWRTAFVLKQPPALTSRIACWASTLGYPYAVSLWPGLLFSQRGVEQFTDHAEGNDCIKSRDSTVGLPRTGPLLYETTEKIRENKKIISRPKTIAMMRLFNKTDLIALRNNIELK